MFGSEARISGCPHVCNGPIRGSIPAAFVAPRGNPTSAWSVARFKIAAIITVIFRSAIRSGRIRVLLNLDSFIFIKVLGLTFCSIPDPFCSRNKDVSNSDSMEVGSRYHQNIYI